MADIELVDLKREFRQARRFDGPFGAIRTLVTREYTTRTALDDVTFAIRPGESVACLGPNGAGKSTTIKILTGILVPSAGHVRVFGNEPHRHRQSNARRIGVVFGQRSQLWWDLPLLDSFDLHRRIYRIEPERFRLNLAFCEEVLRMETFLHTPVRQLSLGQRMRGELAMALLHEPEVLFLDEPTIGLDVLAKDRIREFLKLVNRERGVTIMLTTHDLRDIEELCERILVVNLGKLVYDGRIDALRERLGSQRTIMIEFSDDPGAVEIPHATLVEARGVRKTYAFDRDEVSALDLVSMLPRSLPIADISFEEPDIEEIIRRLYRSMEADRPEQEEIDTWTRGRVVTQ
ncbi:MAG: ATP-binding cassette domain-containing protein [Chloroflexia bacterium]|nr:ATP-binding cassette domain-containing protein [Chloroflexia bacterium]